MQPLVASLLSSRRMSSLCIWLLCPLYSKQFPLPLFLPDWHSFSIGNKGFISTLGRDPFYFVFQPRIRDKENLRMLNMKKSIFPTFTFFFFFFFCGYNCQSVPSSSSLVDEVERLAWFYFSSPIYKTWNPLIGEE